MATNNILAAVWCVDIDIMAVIDISLSWLRIDVSMSSLVSQFTTANSLTFNKSGFGGSSVFMLAWWYL